jgi:hypothetical protein
MQDFSRFATKFLANKCETSEKEALEREVRTKGIECMKLSRELAECKVQL